MADTGAVKAPEKLLYHTGSIPCRFSSTVYGRLVHFDWRCSTSNDRSRRERQPQPPPLCSRWHWHVVCAAADVFARFAPCRRLPSSSRRKNTYEERQHQHKSIARARGFEPVRPGCAAHHKVGGGRPGVVCDELNRRAPVPPSRLPHATASPLCGCGVKCRHSRVRGGRVLRRYRKYPQKAAK